MDGVEIIKENVREIAKRTSLSKADVLKINKINSHQESHIEMKKILQPDGTLNLVSSGPERWTKLPTYWIKDGELLWFDRIGEGVSLSICDEHIFIGKGCIIEIPDTHRKWKTRKGAIKDIDSIEELAGSINKNVNNIFACISEVAERTEVRLSNLNVLSIPQTTKKGSKTSNNKGGSFPIGSTSIATTMPTISASTTSNPNIQLPSITHSGVYKQLVLIMPKDSEYFDMLKPIRAFNAEDEPKYVRELLLNG